MSDLIYINPRDNPSYHYKQVLNDINTNFSGITSGLITANTANYFTTAATLNGTIISFDRNDSFSAYTVDLSSLSGSLDTNTFVTGFTYDNVNSLTISRNDGVNYNVLMDSFSASTISGGTYYGLPIDVNVTGGTYLNSTGIATFNNNTGGTFNVSGFSTGTTPEDRESLYETLSTGAYHFDGVTHSSSTTVNVSHLHGLIVTNTDPYVHNPFITEINFSGETNVPITNISTSDATFLLISSASTLIQQTTFPTPQERRENIYISKVVHPDRTTILVINDTTDYIQSPMSALRDMFSPIKLINDGIVASPNGANLNFNTSAGYLYGIGINFSSQQLNPNQISISAQSPSQFVYRTQTGGTSSTVTTITPNFYDVGGVVTALPGGSNTTTNQRIYLFSIDRIIVQYGQQSYTSLSNALAGMKSEAFIETSNIITSGILIGILSVTKNATDLSDLSEAVFTPASMFGEVGAGTAGISTTTLQQAYNNSTTPEIIINSILDGVTIQNGTGNPENQTNLLEGKNSGGTTTSFLRADGAISGATFYGDGSNLVNIPNIYTTGVTFNNDSLFFSRNDLLSAYTADLSAVANKYWTASTGIDSIVTVNRSHLASGTYSTIVGGTGNTASGNASSVLGGFINSATTTYSSVVGGDSNLASGNNSAVVGGRANQASGIGSFIGGGGCYGTYNQYGNIASGNNSAVVGGMKNRATGDFSLIMGGRYSIANSIYTSVFGGTNNVSSGDRSSVIGGIGSTASAYGSSVIGGTSNLASGLRSSVLGGYLNQAIEGHSVVVGGRQNSATTTYSAVVGGDLNLASGSRSFVGGGSSNSAGGLKSFVGGGYLNSATAYNSVVVGGSLNSATAYYSAVVGGQNNLASGQNSSIIGGSGNTISGIRSIILGGQNINGSVDDTVYVPYLNVGLIGSGTSIINLGLDSSGNIVTGTTGGGTFTGGTVTGETIFTGGVSATTISASTIYSGSTNLYDIFLTSADGNDITRVQGGTNISTGGTENNPIINLDDNIVLASVSATTISGTTFYGDGSQLTGISSAFTGGTVTGETIFTGGVTANTISATTYQNLPPITIGVSLDGQGNVITTGSTGYRIVERSGNVTHWYVIGDVTGSTIFDIKRNSTSIVGAGNKPTLSSQIRNDAAPSSWTSVAITQNDELEFIVDTASILTKAWLFIQIT